MSSSRSSARRRRSQGAGAGRALRGSEPLHQRSDADHDRDAGRGDRELHGDAAEEFVEHQVSHHREQDAEAEDVEGVAPADNEGPRGPASQKPRLGMDQPRDEQGEGEYVGETERPQIRFAQEQPQRLAADQDRNRIVEAVRGPAEANHESGQREAHREAEQPPTVEPGNPTAGAPPAEPRPQEEQRLPGERIEGPHPVGPG